LSKARQAKRSEKREKWRYESGVAGQRKEDVPGRKAG